MVTSRCGILCEQCAYQEETGCEGCTKMEQPLWAESCPVKSCCEAKNLEFCGICTDFPCELLNSFAYDKEHGDNGKRITQCRLWAQNRNT